MQDIVERARDLAHRAHSGQVDKAGRPYIEHVTRVAEAVAYDPVSEAAAWLHDVLEDCPNFAEELWAFPDYVTAAVDKLTRWPGMTPTAYYKRVKRNAIAVNVKIADIADNAAEERLALLDEKTANRLRRKYKRAKLALGVE